MKKQLFLLFLLFVSSLSLVQKQEPKLVLPVGYTSDVTSAVFSPDGKLALTASWDKTARIFEVATDKAQM